MRVTLRGSARMLYFYNIFCLQTNYDSAHLSDSNKIYFTNSQKGSVSLRILNITRRCTCLYPKEVVGGSNDTEYVRTIDMASRKAHS